MGPDSLIPLGCGTRNAALLFTPPPPLAVAAQLVALQEYAEHAQRYELPPSVLFLCLCLMCKTFVSLFALLFSLLFVFSVCTYSFFFVYCVFLLLDFILFICGTPFSLVISLFFLSLPRFPMPPACTVPLFPTLSHRQPQLEGFHCSFFVSFYCLCSPFLLCCLPLLLTVCFFCPAPSYGLLRKINRNVCLCVLHFFSFILSHFTCFPLNVCFQSSVVVFLRCQGGCTIPQGFRLSEPASPPPKKK